jgi:replicative DNA helicase
VTDSGSLSEIAERHILNLLITDTAFVKKASLVLEPNLFSHEYSRRLCRLALSFYRSFSECIGIDNLILELDKEKRLSEEDKENLLLLVEKIADTSVNKEYISKFLNEYAKKKALSLALDKGKNLVEQCQFDRALLEIEKAARVGFDSFGRIDNFFTYQEDGVGGDASEDLFLFEIPKLDSFVSGGRGLEKGMLALILGELKGRKSWFLEYIATQAVLQGKKVVYVTLEMRARQVRRRFAQLFFRLTKEEARKLTRAEFDKKIRPWKRMGGGLFIEDFTNQGGCSIKELCDLVELYFLGTRVEGIIPDMLIVDYADIILPTDEAKRYKDFRHTQYDIFFQLRSLATKYEMWVFTATQSTRASFGRKKGKKDLSEDIRKGAIIDLGISLNVRQEEIENGKIVDLTVFASREGRDNQTVSIIQDIERGSFFVEELDDDRL